MIKEFRKFILRGNIVELVIGFTVGAAFSSVARSIVNDIIMPPISLLLGKSDFSNLYFVLREGITPPPLIMVLVMSGLETTPNAKSAAVIVEVNRISLFVWIEDIDNSNFMNVCTIYRFIKSVFLSIGKLFTIKEKVL